VLTTEQESIETERGKAQQRANAADREVEDVMMAALVDALILLDARRRAAGASSLQCQAERVRRPLEALMSAR
jgi:hypothetical protein